MSATWAVARILLRQARRSGGFRLFAAALLLAAAISPGFGDGDALARLQLAATWGIDVPSFILSIATIVLAAQGVSQELDGRTIELLAAKPLAPWKALLGKLAGAALVSCALLAGIFGIFGARVAWERARLDDSGSDVADRALVEDRFFSVRRSVEAEAREVDEEEVSRRVAELLESRRRSRGSDGAMDHGPTDDHELSAAQLDALRDEAGRQLRTRWVAPGESAELRFSGIPPLAEGERLEVRYELYVSPPLAATTVRIEWSAAGGFERALSLLQSTPHFLDVPPSAVEDGSLVLRLRNAESGEGSVHLVILPGSVEALYPHGSFAANVARAFVVLAGRLVFLAALGTFGAAFFTLPTACLIGCFVLLTGAVSGFLEESFAFFGDDAPPALSLPVSMAGRLLELLPDLAAEDPVNDLLEGRDIGSARALGLFAWNVLARGGILFLPAAAYWSRRELGGRAP